MKLRLLNVIFVSVILCGSLGAEAFAQDLKQHELSIEQHIFIPAAGCDNGRAISNFMLPIHGGAKPSCLGNGKSTSVVLDDRSETTAGMAEVGTVVVLGVSREQVVVAADSRSGHYDLNTKKFKRVDDHRCKLVKLSPTLLFAATGHTRTGPVQSRIYYDSQKLAQAAARNFVFDPTWMPPDRTVIEIATNWAWDVAFRITRGVESGIYTPPQSRIWLTGIFAGIANNSDISVAAAKLEYDKPIPGMIVPKVSISIWSPVPPKDFTWIEAFGHEETVKQYYLSKSATTDSQQEFQRIRAQQLRKPREFAPQVIQHLAELARDNEKHEFPNGSKEVGGKIDIARILRGGSVEWIKRKRECPSVGAN